MDAPRSPAPPDGRLVWLATVIPSVPLAIVAASLLFACDGDGMECLADAVVGGAVLFVAAPTLLVVIPLASAVSAPPWVIVALALVTSAPLWYVAARALARRLARSGRLSSGRFTAWWAGCTLVWTVGSLAFVLVVAAVFTRLR